MTDPAAMEGMMGMMKGNMAMMIPQTLIMSWINAFFAGFVISRSNALFNPRPNSVARMLMLIWPLPISEASVSPDDSIQVHAAVWCCDKGFGRAMGFKFVMVFLESFRAAVCLHIYPRR